MQGCFVCFQPDPVVIIEAEIGEFFLKVPLCKNCEKRLRNFEKYLVVCITCGTFRILDFMSVALLYKVLIKTPYQSGKVNIIPIDYCQTCELIGIEPMGRA